MRRLEAARCPAVVLVAVTIAIGLSGCAAPTTGDGGSTPAAGPQAPSSGPTADAGGGAELLTPRDGAPGFCSQLAADPDIRAVPTSLPKALSGDAGAAGRLRSAADGLRTYAREGLGDPAVRMATALDAVADGDSAQAGRLDAVGSELDARMRTVCGTA